MLVSGNGDQGTSVGAGKLIMVGIVGQSLISLVVILLASGGGKEEVVFRTKTQRNLGGEIHFCAKTQLQNQL